MTTHEQSDIEDLRMLTKFLAAHARCGTEPHADTYRRYMKLLARVGMAERRNVA